MIKMNKWDRRFLLLARHISEWSKDPSTQVGAVIVDKKRRIVGLGYNGFPAGVEDTEERYRDRDTKYAMVVHAEVNAILNSVKDVEGCTLYVWPLFSCNECAKLIIQSGISEVVSIQDQTDRWNSKHEVSKTMFSEAGIRYSIYQRNDIGLLP